MDTTQVDFSYKNFGIYIKGGFFKVLFPGGRKHPRGFESKEEAIAFIDSMREQFKDVR